MTDLRTAAQQALEALELAQTDVHWELNSPTRKFLRKAEKALRAALAEPVQERLTIEEIVGHTCECVDDGTFNMSCAVSFARAIEKAHGIGDDK